MDYLLSSSNLFCWRNASRADAFSAMDSPSLWSDCKTLLSYSFNFFSISWRSFFKRAASACFDSRSPEWNWTLSSMRMLFTANMKAGSTCVHCGFTLNSFCLCCSSFGLRLQLPLFVLSLLFCFFFNLQTRCKSVIEIVDRAGPEIRNLPSYGQQSMIVKESETLLQRSGNA